MGIWGESWDRKKETIKASSPYGHFPSYRLRTVIVKGNYHYSKIILIKIFLFKYLGNDDLR